jgi:Ca-activated chloride channel homolog
LDFLNLDIIDKILNNDIKFLNPEAFYLILLNLLYIIYYIFTNLKNYPSLNISNSLPPNLIKNINLKVNFKAKFRHILFLINNIALLLFITALARPQSSSSRKEVTSDGIDIILALDISTSMLAEDLKPNRIEAAKKTAIEFIENRESDRIGLVVFSGESYTSCPITSDHTVLKNLITNLKSGMITDGTAIGLGLSTAISRLKDSKAKSKVIVLLTDGSNNSGNIAPETASEIAQVYNIKVYTIGIGTKGKAPYPMQTPYGRQYVMVDVDIDEKLLSALAESTNGIYFRATSTKSLKSIYSKIDKLEKSKIEQFYYSKKSEEFHIFLFLGILLFLIDLILKYTYFRVLQ